MRILRHGDYKRMPWKNGLGVTEELIAFPPDSDLSSFGWRVSIAHVGADGPFSVFTGIDRTIALLDGDGLSLDLPDSRTVELTSRSDPFAFSGDLEISSRNMAGPTVDLNIMTRRGHFRHEMRRLKDPELIEIDGAADLTVLVFNSACAATIDGRQVRMERFDALVGDAQTQVHLGGDAAIDVLRIDISAVG